MTRKAPDLRPISEFDPARVSAGQGAQPGALEKMTRVLDRAEGELLCCRRATDALSDFMLR
jgi:hypothetical protein